MIARRPSKISSRISGYSRVEEPLTSLALVGGFIALEEELSRVSTTLGSGLFLPDSGNAKIGRVLKVGNLVSDIFAGDKVLFEEWQGGKWAFLDSDKAGGETKCLILNQQHILAKIEGD